MSGKKGMYWGHNQQDQQRGFGVVTPHELDLWLEDAPPAEWWRRSK